MQRYTVTDFMREFRTDFDCLEYLKELRWPDGIFCETCKRVTEHHPMKARRSFSCQSCGWHVHPTAGTIFHKSTTPLKLWFYTIYLMAQTRGGISAKQVERETGVTYKTAWRMCKQIRSALDERDRVLVGMVEADETYIGGRPRWKGEQKAGRGTRKTPVLGIVERDGGKARVFVLKNVSGRSVLPLIRDNVQWGSTVYTDELNVYHAVGGMMGYKHKTIHHTKQKYVVGDIHTNSVEGLWSLIKRGISGVYHSVGPAYLQSYCNEYVFRYNHRNDMAPMFKTFLRRAVIPSQSHGQPRLESAVDL
jgi:transposase-like protein